MSETETLQILTSEQQQKQTFLAEYQAAQASAEHHDNLVWNVTSLHFVGSAVLMGLVLGKIDSPLTILAKLAVLAVAIAGITLTVCVWSLAYKLRRIKIFKYHRCKEIEKMLGMEQHLKLGAPEGEQTKIYDFFMSLFLSVWLVLLVFISIT